MTLPTTSQFLDLKETAKILDIHYETLRRKIAEGEFGDLEFYKPYEKARPRVTLESLERHIKRHTTKEL